MGITKLELKRFTAFEDITIDFSPGINVFIGANSTGKTHLLKLLYSLVKACGSIHNNSQIQTKDQITDAFTRKLEGVFKPDKLGRLARHRVGASKAEITLTYDDSFILNLTLSSKSNLTVEYGVKLPHPESSIYLPAHEFLSIQEGFIAAYNNRETAFDETYYDLSVALNASPLKGPKLEEIKQLLKPLKNVITDNVTQVNGRFYLGNVEAPLVSEGFRKLAGLLYLVNNGSLTKHGLLFWDEPEANLNPRLIVTVKNVLRTLARSEVQIFVATHDYLLTNELALIDEYHKDVPIRFFALQQTENNQGIVVESAENLADLSHNPILEEFAAHYDREMELFNRS